METEIKRSYLMWIGKEHYPTIEAYVEECTEMGVSKRLPNATVAEAMTAPGTVVFVAHDEGVYRECPECVGEMECPTCRLDVQELARIGAELKDFGDEKVELDAEFKKLDTWAAGLRIAKGVALKGGTPMDAEDEAVLADAEAKLKKLGTASKRTATKARKRTEKMTALIEKTQSCPECDGTMKVNGGTGGTVAFNDGETWDHVRYNYWLHQPKRWTPSLNGGVKEVTQCECCGGTGRLPEGRVFGCFIPRHAEYILKAEDTDAVKAEMEARKFKTVSTIALAAEKKRGCGKRSAGGVYVVAAGGAGTVSKDAKSVVEELVKTGAIEADGASINGDFAQFLSPVKIDAKRFRGIKSWSLDPDVEDEAEMVLDALAS